MRLFGGHETREGPVGGTYPTRPPSDRRPRRCVGVVALAHDSNVRLAVALWMAWGGMRIFDAMTFDRGLELRSSDILRRCR